MKDNDETKEARIAMAKYQSFSTAAEFIRSHGEEGFTYHDEKFNKEYLKANLSLSKYLDRQANIWNKIYHKTGVEIDTSHDTNY